MKRPAVNYIVQLDVFHLNEFMFLWMYCEQPCSLLFMKAKTAGLTAVKLVVDSDEAAEFLLRVQQKIGCTTYKMP